MGQEQFKYYVRGYSSKSHKKKRVQEVKLPKLNKPVKVYPRSSRGNERIYIREGEFISETPHLLFLKPMGKAKKLEAFSKTDLRYKIYIYDYIK